MIPGYRASALLGGLAGLSGVIMAAIGSHAVPGMDDPSTMRSWLSASLIHLVHAAVLLALAAIMRHSDSKTLGLSVIFCAVGTAVFSGSIYISLITGTHGTGGWAPVGGVLLMLGWLLIIVDAARS